MRDYISRQAAIDVVKRLMRDSELSKTVQTGLHILPSIQPPSKCVAEIRIDKEDLEDLVAEKVEEIKEAMLGNWIPCSERPPKKPGSYICTCSDGTPYLKVTVIKFHPRTKAWELNGTRAYWKVRAWMPLPEPYQPKESES